LLCRIPAWQFEAGERLTRQAETAARSTARLVAERLSLLHRRWHNQPAPLLPR